MGDKTDTSSNTTKPSVPLHPVYTVTDITKKVRILDGVKVTYSAWVKLFNLHARGYEVLDHITNDPPAKDDPTYALEYMQSGRATEKTDIYSFGVLVLEVISGKRPTDASFIEKGLNIVGWLNHLITEDRQREIIDTNCEGVESETLDALLSVAIQCVSSSPEDRPTMHRVVQTLESEVMTPCPSDFYDSSSD